MIPRPEPAGRGRRAARAAGLGLALFSAGLGAGQAGEAAAKERASVELQTFDFVYTRISEVHPEPEALGAAWAQRYAELRPAAATAKSADDVADVILALLQGLPGAHHALLRADGRRLSGASFAPREAADEAAETTPEAPPPPAPAPVRPPRGPAAPAAPAAPFVPGEQGMPGLLPVYFEGAVRVGWIEPGGPAEAAGLRLGDALLRVDGVGCADRPSACLQLDRPPGAALRLEVEGAAAGPLSLPPSQPRTLTTPPIGATPGMQTQSLSARVPLSGGGHAALLGFSAMSMNTVQHINQRMPQLQAEGARGLVLDLRGNPGGLLVSAAGLAGYLIDQPTSLGRVRTRQDALELMAYPRPAAQRFTGPVAVLIDEGSASTAELIAASLQELGRARVFGERSRGAVETSTIELLPNGDRLQLVIATIHTAKGAALEGAGVRPDVRAPGASTRGASGQDRALDAALSWINTTAAPPAADRPPGAP